MYCNPQANINHKRCWFITTGYQLIRWMDFTMVDKFNITKCCCVHFSPHIFPIITHFMVLYYHVQITVNILGSYFNQTGQTCSWENIANSMLGLLQRNIISLHKRTSIQSTSSPKFEYACTVWSHWQQYFIDNLEKESPVECCSICIVMFTIYVQCNILTPKSLMGALRSLSNESSLAYYVFNV